MNVNTANANNAAVTELTPNQRAWRRFRQNRPAVWSAWFLAALALAVVAWPLALKLAPLTGRQGAEFARIHDPNRVSDDQFQPPNARYWFGTDVHGRDLFSRVLYGAQISLLVGLVGAGVSLLIGVSWGAVAGYVGGRLDNWMMRTVDVLYSLPSIIFVIVLITTLEGLLKQALAALGAETLARQARLLFLFVGLGAVSWLTMARIVRGQVLSLRTRAFVEASRALGAGPLHILRRHILPNVAGVVLVYLTLTVPAVMLYESFLSYLGLGIQPPMASWGSLIAEGADQMNPIRIYWWLIVFPGGALVSTLLALNFLGDGLRDALDVRG
ncbi:MAG: ABC transporter permease [Verrucomicrobiae bacterium]|nr:ABC transporter permease [Verrucomicrobiae bacterium]MDW8308279.1 ABC transporter permease [Verrucomicrobiales bacterium]